MDGKPSVDRAISPHKRGPEDQMPIEGQSVEDRIKAALVKSLRLKMDPTAIPDDVPLIGRGLGLDSVSVLQLVGAVEEVFDITVDDTDINKDLFQNIAALASYVRGKLDAK